VSSGAPRPTSWWGGADLLDGDEGRDDVLGEDGDHLLLGVEGMGTMRWEMCERTNGWRRSPPEGGNHVGGDAIAEPEHAIEELGEQFHGELRSVPE
jgi:hypothetical protein